MKVLYVSGWCRSGSTLLGNVLGELPGVVHVGEMHYLWRNGVLRTGTNTTCGCGLPVADCPLWSAVLEAVAGPDPVATAQAMLTAQGRYLRTRHTAARLAEAVGRRTRPAELVTALRRSVAAYRAVAARTEARLVVDSSKYPAEAAALLDSDVDLRVLHLIRDPRASANSWRRAKDYIPAMPVGRSTRYWTASNLASEWIGRRADHYLRLRYEDFTADPAGALGAVLRLTDLDDEPPVDDAGRVELGVNHTVTGNPDRLVHGAVTIRADEAWRAQLPTASAALATALAMPALRRYGYPYHR